LRVDEGEREDGAADGWVVVVVVAVIRAMREGDEASSEGVL
jgi:hypothetical protein